ncbi:MAG: C40 family peptidase [Geodermatophilaceae bacterium]|nr:C40 family peptidase [Geodermatophilaceae bacterium]
MATPTQSYRFTFTHTLFRLLAVLCACVVAVTIAPSTALADPPAPEDASAAAQLVAELGRDLEILQEEQNEAQVALDRYTAEAAASTVALGQVNSELVDLNGRVRGIARSAFAGDGLNSFSAILTSGSPQEFLDRVNTLEFMSGRDGALLVEATRTREEAESLNNAADVAVVSAQAVVAEIATRRTELESQIQKYQDLFAALSAQERAALVGSPESRNGGSDSGDDGSEAGDGGSESGDGGQAPPGEIIAPSEAARIAVETAYAQLGDTYVWGGEGPDEFDCSGLTMYSYAAAGVSLPHSSKSQSSMGVAVSRDELLPGDLVFYYSPVSHVAIYVGDGQIIHASTYGKPVSLDSVDPWGAYNSARRIAGG